MSRMFCIGHSHMRCVEEAAAKTTTELDVLQLWLFGPPIADQGSHLALHANILSRLRAPVFSFVGGSAHDVIGLVRHPRPFDFVLPEAAQSPLQDGAEILPLATIRGAMQELMEVHTSTIALLPKAARGPVFQFETPPPMQDGPLLTQAVVELRKFPVAAGFFRADRSPLARAGSVEDGEPSLVPSPQNLRYKLWRLYSQMCREVCEAHGAVFVPHPAEAVDELGFLKPELFAFAGHANSIYGEMVLRQMRELSS